MIIRETISKYKIHGFTTDTSDKIKRKAKELNNLIGASFNVDQAVKIVRQWLNNISYDTSCNPPKPIRLARSLIESRSVKASELIVSPVASCGSLVTLGASVLREIGYPVKLIHGSHPRSMHHAWIEIYNHETKKWEPYDFTGFGKGPYGEITKQHKRILECADWFEIKDYLNKEHERYIKNKLKSR